MWLQWGNRYVISTEIMRHLQRNIRDALLPLWQLLLTLSISTQDKCSTKCLWKGFLYRQSIIKGSLLGKKQLILFFYYYNQKLFLDLWCNMYVVIDASIESVRNYTKNKLSKRSIITFFKHVACYLLIMINFILAEMGFTVYNTCIWTKAEPKGRVTELTFITRMSLNEI